AEDAIPDTQRCLVGSEMCIRDSEDLLDYGPFVEETEARIRDLAARRPGPRLLVGMPFSGPTGLVNAAVLLHGGRLVHVYAKASLPNYGVFDEKRYFEAGSLCPVYVLGPWRIGVSVCEDIWTPTGVHEVQARAGAQVLVNISSSPYEAGKGAEREELIRRRARQHGVFLAYLNLVGGQDELVFDGRSLVSDPEGNLLARGKAFETDLILVDVDPEQAGRVGPARGEPVYRPGRYEEIRDIEGKLRSEIVDVGAPEPDEERPALPARNVTPIESLEEEIYRALVLGTADYVRKNGFREIVLGLSGGIDSALTAVIACDALGSGAVHGLTMPSRYTSASSLAGAEDLASNLDISLERIPIDSVLDDYKAALAPILGDGPLGLTEENLQARIRGNLLMALSNHRGWLVLTTGNKSELAVGYCTLYGDMAGGFAVLKDVPKQMVYRLARWRNAGAHGTETIPEDTLTRPPSAELREDQKDSDTLPPYPILDPILEARIEREEPLADLVAAGVDPEIARKVYAWVDASEYKRRQAPPGIKITHRAFGKDRRYPITNRYRPR
ncbi:MAG: NAD+ synthase, partial [Candidatus Eisenbacteria bacterium]|nr:NAD+ synthase [Candidatus Eisenbacteria bacterium]